jgi:hypothetical protein
MRNRMGAMPTVRLDVVKISGRANYSARCQFDIEARHTARKTLLRQSGLKLPIKSIERLKLHHIVPVSLSGALPAGHLHSLKNLALVDDDLHAAIHEFIDEQLRGVRAGQRTSVAIPILPEPVWNQMIRIAMADQRRHG